MLAAARIVMFIRRGSGEKKAPEQLFHEEQRVKHDGFGEGDGQNCLHQDGCGRARISADRGSRAHADESYADRGAKSRETNVKVAAYFCEYWLYHIFYLGFLSNDLRGNHGPIVEIFSGALRALARVAQSKE